MAPDEGHEKFISGLFCDIITTDVTEHFMIRWKILGLYRTLKLDLEIVMKFMNIKIDLEIVVKFMNIETLGFRNCCEVYYEHRTIEN